MEQFEIYPFAAEDLCQQLSIQRSLTKDERDAIDGSDFAWPEEQKYPIDTQAHLDAAAKLIGRAPESVQAKIKANAIRIAKKKGLTLPDSWQEEDSSDDESQERSVQQDVTSESLNVYLPIMRADTQKRMVFGQATAEVPDAYGTIFGYCPEAWTQWRGNVREQHDPKKAVGKRIELDCDAQERAIYVGAQVSRGAPDTWAKVEDGVLNGFSAAVLPDPEYGSDPRKWPKKEYNGKHYPYLPKYRVLELSLVDHPATPGCNIQIVRADGFITDVVEPEEEQSTVKVGYVSTDGQWHDGEPSLERAGARVSADTRGGIHQAMAGTLKGVAHMANTCGCPMCQAICSVLDPDGDGDIDWMGLDDPDNDAANLGVAISATDDNDTDEAMMDRMQRVMAPIYQRQQQFLARFAQVNIEYSAILERLSKLDEIASVLERVASNSSLDEVRSALAEVKGQVEHIANTPQPGGPVLHGAARPYDKTNPYAPAQQQQESQFEVLERLHKQGAFKTLDDQIAAASLLMKPQQMRG